MFLQYFKGSHLFLLNTFVGIGLYNNMKTWIKSNPDQLLLQKQIKQGWFFGSLYSKQETGLELHQLPVSRRLTPTCQICNWFHPSPQGQEGHACCSHAHTSMHGESMKAVHGYITKKTKPAPYTRAGCLVLSWL